MPAAAAGFMMSAPASVNQDVPIAAASCGQQHEQAWLAHRANRYNASQTPSDHVTAAQVQRVPFVKHVRDMGEKAEQILSVSVGPDAMVAP